MKRVIEIFCKHSLRLNVNAEQWSLLLFVLLLNRTDESRWYPVTICWEYQSPESPLDCKEIKPFNLKGNQPWILIGRTDAETPVFSSSDVNSWLIGKVPDAGKDWGQKENRGWNGWMASPMQWTWTEANFVRWWGRERAGVLQSMGLQKVWHDWATEQQQLEHEASLVAQIVKNLPAVQETWVWSLGQEDPLEKRTTTHSNILACAVCA